MAHAGGQYVWQHAKALRLFSDVVLFAPETPLNRDALRHADTGAPSRLLRGVGPGGTGRLKTLYDIESAWQGSSVAWPYRRLFQTSKAPWSELATADLIEFHWSEMIAVAPYVRAHLPGVPLVGVAHDVITQRWGRAALATSNPVSRFAYGAAARRSKRQEARSFRALDALLVFSEKDADLAQQLAPATRIEVVHPGLGPSTPPVRTVDPSAPVVLFTGALDRADNARGIAWFLDSMWPSIVEAVPAARLVVAGANPQPPLVRAVEKAKNAELTGFVESLDPWYSQARVFIAPLQTGAGVKFKTLDAMLRGVPVVSTSVGAEGIAAEELFAAITDDPGVFAAEVIAQLRNPDDARAAQAQRWADGVYGVSSFQERLRRLYAELLTGR